MYLSGFRTSSGFGVGSISFQDIMLYLEKKCNPSIPEKYHFLVSHQVSIIDGQYKSVSSKLNDNKGKGRKSPQNKNPRRK